VRQHARAYKILIYLIFIYLFIYLFIVNARTIRTVCKNEVQSNNKNYDNAKYEIKSHTSLCKHATSEKLISDSRRVQTSVQPVKWHYYYTELYYGYQQSTGKKIRKVPLELLIAKNSIAPHYRLMPTKQHTETRYRTKNLRL